VTDDLDHQVQQALKRPRKSSKAPLYLFMIAAAAGISGYIWLNYDSLAKLAVAGRSSDKSVLEGNGAGVAQTDFENFKRETAASVQSTNDAIAAQEEELKGLSDRIKTLTAKIDALQTPPAIAPVPSSAEPRQSAPAAPAASVAARKRVVGRTAGPISVGGAPLPPPPTNGQ
jgi:hypothetical protein